MTADEGPALDAAVRPAAPEELREAVAAALFQHAYPRAPLPIGMPFDNPGRDLWFGVADAALAVTQAAQETAVAAARVEVRREGAQHGYERGYDDAREGRQRRNPWRRLAAGEEA